MSRTPHFLPPWARGLSARLLLLTIVFVMVAEVFIYLPSIARFRHAYLETRLSNAHLAMMALDSATSATVGPVLTQRLLDHAEASAIVLRSTGQGTLMLMHDQVPKPDLTVDLRMPDRIVLRLTEEAVAARAENTKKKLQRGVKGIDT